MAIARGDGLGALCDAFGGVVPGLVPAIGGCADAEPETMASAIASPRIGNHRTAGPIRLIRPSVLRLRGRGVLPELGNLRPVHGDAEDALVASGFEGALKRERIAH